MPWTWQPGKTTCPPVSSELHQWDVVKVRINPEDRDEHPAVIISPEELCADLRKTKLNVLYGTTRRPGENPRPHRSSVVPTSMASIAARSLEAWAV